LPTQVFLNREKQYHFMKGMELSLHVIVILALAIIVLVSVLFFVFSQSGEQISKTEANRIFQEKCSL